MRTADGSCLMCHGTGRYYLYGRSQQVTCHCHLRQMMRELTRADFDDVQNEQVVVQALERQLGLSLTDEQKDVAVVVLVSWRELLKDLYDQSADR